MASVAGNSAAMASVVFRPLPVMQTTVVSSGLMRPCAISFWVTPAVTPPAVSVKIPSVSASSLMATTISGSETSSAQPPESRICFMAKGPSGGLPMASARAVDGGVENFRRLEVSGDEYAGVKSLLGGLRSDGVGEITGRGATDSGEMESARSGESRGHDAIFEGEGREANGVILEIEILQSPFCGKLLRGDQRCAADGVRTDEVFRKRE